MRICIAELRFCMVILRLCSFTCECKKEQLVQCMISVIGKQPVVTSCMITVRCCPVVEVPRRGSATHQGDWGYPIHGQCPTHGMLRVWNFYQHVGKYSMQAAYGI